MMPIHNTKNHIFFNWQSIFMLKHPIKIQIEITAGASFVT